MKVLPLYLPHQGCSHQCVYCNQPLTVGVIDDRPLWRNRLRSVFSSPHDAEWEIAFYSGTFTALPRSVTDACFDETAQAKQCGTVKGYRVSTRPDCVDEATLDYLRERGVTTIELGIESLEDRVLEKSGRGHSAAEARDACRRVRQRGFQLGIHLMCGLPGQSETSWMKTVHESIALHPDCVRIAPTIVLKNTPLEKLYQRGRYQPLSLTEAVRQTAYAYQRFVYHHIAVIRVGLALSDEQGCGEDKITAGPWHPSLRHEVESMLAFQSITHAILDQPEPRIHIHPKDLSIVYGNKKSNLQRWIEQGRTIQIQPDPVVSRHRFVLHPHSEQALFGIPDDAV